MFSYFHLKHVQDAVCLCASLPSFLAACTEFSHLGLSLHIPLPLPQATFGTAGTFLLFAVVAVAAVVFIWKLVPETKGLSLEEIQRMLAHE